MQKLCHDLSLRIPKNEKLSNYLSERFICHKRKTNLLSVAPTTSNQCLTTTILKADSGASTNFLKSSDAHLLTNKTPIHNGPSATLPNKERISPSETGHLPITKLSSSATSSYVYPELTNASLLSIGKLSDDDCIAIFTKRFLHVFKNTDVI